MTHDEENKDGVESEFGSPEEKDKALQKAKRTIRRLRKERDMEKSFRKEMETRHNMSVNEFDSSHHQR